MSSANNNITVISLTATENGTYTAESGYAYSPVIVNVQNAPDDVNFYDYDGTLLYNYTSSEFLALTAMPSNPTHSGLTSQGWNWSLADAQSYVEDYGALNIGQMYITDDETTRLYVTMEEGRLSPVVGFYLNGTATVDWGDGSSADTATTSSSQVVSFSHTYSSAGDYVVVITPSSGASISFYGTSNYYSMLFVKAIGDTSSSDVYRNCIQRIELGQCTLSTAAFGRCYSLASITIPSSVTSIGNYAFRNCYSLASVTIPSSVTSIGNYMFYYCHSLASITIPSSVTSIGIYVFYHCHSLASVTIPSSVTSIGNQAFFYCYALVNITIPSGVTSIGTQAFSDCSSLVSVTIPSGVTSIGSHAFSSCFSLASITIPSGVTSIINATLIYCHSLASITIPSSVTSIGNQAFQDCFSLVSITIPSSVTSIGSQVFYQCYGISSIMFEGTTPPTVSNSNAWTNIPTDCIIYVPSGSLSAYTSATNYPSSSTYTYVEY